MGSKGGGGGGGYSSPAPATVTPTTSTTTSSIPPEVLANYQAIVGAAQNVASQPLQQYGGPMLAGFTPQQNAGFSGVNNAVGSYQPYFNQANGLVNNATTFDPATLQKYMSPYNNDVIKSTMDLAHQNDAQQQQALTGNAISKGAWGGDRAGVASAALSGQQQLADNATIANLENQNYAQGLGAMQNANQASLTGASTLGTMGNAAQANNLAGASAQLQAGQLQQTQAQNALNIPYEQFQQQQQYPFQTTGWLSNIVEGLGANQGGSSTTTTGPAHAAGGRIRFASGGDVPNADINIVGAMPTNNWATANLPNSGTGGAMVMGPNGQMVPQSSLGSIMGGIGSMAGGFGGLMQGAGALGGLLGGAGAAADGAAAFAEANAWMDALPLLAFHRGGTVPRLADGGVPNADVNVINGLPTGATGQSMSDVVAGTPTYSFAPMNAAMHAVSVPSTANNFVPPAGASTAPAPSVAYGQPGDPAGWAKSNNLVPLPNLTSTQLSALAADYPNGNGPGTRTDPFAGRADKYAYRTAGGMGFAPPAGSIYAQAIGAHDGGRVSHLAGGGVPSGNYEIVPVPSINFASAHIPGSDTRGAVEHQNPQSNYLSQGLGALTTGFGLYGMGKNNGWWGQPADFGQVAQDNAFNAGNSFMDSTSALDNGLLNGDTFFAADGGRISPNEAWKRGGSIPMHYDTGGVLDSNPLSNTGLGSMGPLPVGATGQSMSDIVAGTPVYSFAPQTSAKAGVPVQSTANNFIPAPQPVTPVASAPVTPQAAPVAAGPSQAVQNLMAMGPNLDQEGRNTLKFMSPADHAAYMTASQNRPFAQGGAIGRYDDGGGIPQGVPTNADNVLDPMSNHQAFQQSLGSTGAQPPSGGPVADAIQQITQASAPSQPATPEDTGLGAYQNMVPKPDWGQALTTAGLAMMAGKSPNALANIGEGGQAGMKNYEEQKANQREAQAKAVEMAQKAEAMQMGKYQPMMGADGSTLMFNAKTGKFEPAVDANGNPVAVSQYSMMGQNGKMSAAMQMAWAMARARGDSQPTNNDLMVAGKYLNKGEVVDQNGNVQQREGSDVNTGPMPPKAASILTDNGITPALHLIDKGQLASNQKDFDSAQGAWNGSMNSKFALQEAAPTLATSYQGLGSEWRANAATALANLANVDAPEGAAATQELSKMSNQITTAAVNSSHSSRFGIGMEQFYKNSTINPTNSKQANMFIYDNAMRLPDVTQQNMNLAAATKGMSAEQKAAVNEQFYKEYPMMLPVDPKQAGGQKGIYNVNPAYSTPNLVNKWLQGKDKISGPDDPAFKALSPGEHFIDAQGNVRVKS